LDGLGCEALESRQLLAASPQLFVDLQGTDEATRANSAVIGETYFFAANGPLGEELWKSDGTPEGTLRVKDINPGPASSAPRYLTNVNGTLFFSADDGIHGAELWTSDGTEAGTVLVADLRPDGEGAFPASLANVNGMLLFAAHDGTRGYELWKSNGTAAGTELLKELVPGTSGGHPQQFTQAGANTYFTAVDASLSRQLWRTDGSTAGTIRLASFIGNYNSASQLTNVNGTLFFTVQDGSYDLKIWTSNGTSAGTKPISGIPVSQLGVGGSNLVSFGGSLYYFARESQAVSADSALFKTDGTLAGTAKVLAGVAHGFEPRPNYLTAVESTLYYSAYDEANGYGLWKSDGSGVGTTRIANLAPRPLTSSERRFTPFNGGLLFLANDGAHGAEIWKSDGTADGTLLLKDVAPAAADIQLSTLGVGATNVFFIDRSNFAGAALWKSDGTEAGTGLVEVVAPAEGLNAYPIEYLQIGDVIYLATNSGLWKSPVGGGTATLLTAEPAQGLIEVDGRVFFKRIFTYDSQIWTSDGTPEGTLSIYTRTQNAFGPFYLSELNDRLYFSDVDELWTSDGTVAGTTRIKDIRPGTYPPLTGLTNVNGTLFFAASDAGNTPKLWKSDGTEAGTQEVNPELEVYNPSQFTNVGGLLYYVAMDTEHGTELWVSDGTVAGTALLKDVQPGAEGPSPARLTNVAGRLYFTADDGLSGEELWTSDGTEAGTQLVTDLNAEGSANFQELVAVGDTLYFVADDGAHQLELWRTNALTGPTLVADLNDAGGSDPQFLTNVNGLLYFTADDGTSGRQLWRTDGTHAGTIQLLWAGPFGPEPRALTNVNGALMFSANDGVSGRDPWVIRAPGVVGRHLFYNNSAFDGHSGNAEAADDGAIATDRTAYLPGSGVADTASVTSFVHGINGLMIDIAGLEGGLTAQDFTFRMGTSNSPESWALAPAPLEMVVRYGEGAGGSDRVTITWVDGAMKNTWLQVIVEGNDAAGEFNSNTGLAASDVFYFGSRVGDTFVGAAPAATVTSAADELGARFHPGIDQPVTNVFDFNRDGVVNAADQLIARNNAGLLLMIELDEPLLSDSFEHDLPLGAAGYGELGFARVMGSPRWWLAFALAAAELEEELAAGVSF